MNLYTEESDALDDLLEPKAIMMSDIFPHHWAYRISRNQARKLLSLDASGRQIKSNLNDPSNHRVLALPEKSDKPLVFFKANGNPPIQPEKEFMLYSLYQHLQIPVPETGLLVLTDVFEANPEYFYAVQASEAVLGESPLKAYQNPEVTFDHAAYVSQAVGALLTNPSDGSFKNFKYSPKYQTFICIDNDLVFKPEIAGPDDKKIVNVKSILYLLPEIDHLIPKAAKTLFMTLDPHLTILLWLHDLAQKNYEYNALFTKLAFQKARCIYQNLLPQNEVPSLAPCLQQKVIVDLELHHDNFFPQILVSKDLLTRLTENLQIIEKILQNNSSINFQRLFEEISPVLGKYYRKLRLEFNDPEEALEALWGEKKNNIDYSYLSSLLDQEELSSLLENHSLSPPEKEAPPETFFKEYKSLLTSKESPLDRFIRRHSQRIKKNSLNFQEALRELKFLVQERLTDSKCIQDIIDFSHSLSTIINHDHFLVKKITSLLSSLPHPELKWLLTLEKHFRRIGLPFQKSSIPSSLVVNGAFMKQRTFVLTESENKYLFDEQGNIKKNVHLTGRSAVTYFPEENPEFYLKQYPEWPGYEFASTLFMRLLGVTRLPYQDLIIIDSKYPVLLSQKVSGSPVFRAWDDPQAFQNLDPFHTGLLIISAMLINPEDGKEDNFILSEDGKYLIPIDSDHCFLPSFSQKEGKIWNLFTVNTALQTKTILFSLDEMDKPLPLEVCEHILSIEFDLLLPQWMTELDKFENKFNNLVEQDERERFFEQGTVMRIPFYKQFIQNLHWKAHKIQDIFKVVSQPTPFDLLKAVEPFAAKCYQDSFQQGNCLQTRFRAATHKLYTKIDIDGSRMSILNTRTMMEIVNLSEEELQKDSAFQRMGPVNALELLNQLIETRSEMVQRERELLCELDEKNQEKKWINLFGNPPVETALKIFFTYPKEGLALKGSKLLTSKKLIKLFAQAPNQGMRIRFLSLTDSPVLTNDEIRVITIECPNIEYLNVSGCMNLKKIIIPEGKWPLLSRVEARDCEKLEKLSSYSPVKILRMGTATANPIKIFVERFTLDICIISTKANQFEFSLRKAGGFEVKSLGRILSQENFIQSMLSEKEEDYFRDINIKLGKYSISSRTDLEIFITCINLQNSNIQAQDIQRISSFKLSNLKTLDLPRNKITGKDSLEYLIQGDWPELKHLDLSENEITNKEVKILAQGNWPLLETLNLGRTKITTKGVEDIADKAKWPKLRSLNISDTKINNDIFEALAHANWPLLEALDLRPAGGTKKGFLNFVLNADWPHLKKIDFVWNEKSFAESLLPKNWPKLEKLDLKQSNITDKEIELIVNKSNWPKLKHVDLSDNAEIGDKGLDILSQTNWPLLEVLDLTPMRVTKKGFLNLVLNTGWANLKKIDCSLSEKNFVESLLLKNWLVLERIDLKKSEITYKEIELIVRKSKWPQLKHLDIADNAELGDKGLEILSQGNWPLLETLNLERTKATAKGIGIIAKTTQWTQLKHLNLSGNTEINDDVLEFLVQANWPLIETLDLKETKITTKGFLTFVLSINWPNLKEVDFNRGEKNFVESLLPKNWHRLERLDLGSCKITRKEIKLMAEKSSWPQLKYLSLDHAELDDKELEALSWGKWPLLEMLHLTRTQITAKGVEVIVRMARWKQLKHLNLSANPQFHDGILEILTQAKWPLLETLDLTETSVTKKGSFNFIFTINWPNFKQINFGIAQCLFQKNWPGLEKLDLSYGKFTYQEIKLVVEKSNWPQLKYLSLAGNTEINDKALEMLAQTDWPLLETLDLKDTGVTKKGLLHLVLVGNWTNLKEINLRSSQKNFAESLLQKNWHRLEKLDLKQSNVTDKEIELIVEKSNWPKMKHLILSDNGDISNRGLGILSRGNWPELEILNLGSTGVTAIEIEVISSMCQWTKLKHLNLSGNGGFYDYALDTLVLAKWPLLETLDLRATKVTKKGCFNFLFEINCPNFKRIYFGSADHFFQKEWPELERLNLSSFNISQKEIGLIVEKSNWPQLKHLNLSHNSKIYDSGLEILALANWPLLETLQLVNTQITKKGLFYFLLKARLPKLEKIDNNWGEENFAESLLPKNWNQLEELNLSFSNISQKEIELIAEKSNWPQLKHLNLSHNGKIDDSGFEVLNSVKWPLLEYLNLSYTNITHENLKIVANNELWPNLKKFVLSRRIKDLPKE